MRKLLLITTILLCYSSIAYTQSNALNRCLAELKPIIETANSVWQDEEKHYGLTPERCNRYSFYCQSACDVIDKHLPQISDHEEKLGLQWGKVDLISELLEIYEEHNWGLTQSEYITLLSKKVSTLELMRNATTLSSEEAGKSIESLNIEEALGEHYFKQKNYEKAKSHYSACINLYATIASSYNQIDENNMQQVGQRIYYWMGYSVYKLGQASSAQYYYNRAKDFLNDDLIQQYK